MGEKTPVEIRNDEEYFALLGRILNGAEYLSWDDLSTEQRYKAMRVYDELWRIAREYRLGGEMI
jgi:hypothetical protein